MKVWPPNTSLILTLSQWTLQTLLLKFNNNYSFQIWKQFLFICVELKALYISTDITMREGLSLKPCKLIPIYTYSTHMHSAVIIHLSQLWAQLWTWGNYKALLDEATFHLRNKELKPLLFKSYTTIAFKNLSVQANVILQFCLRTEVNIISYVLNKTRCLIDMPKKTNRLKCMARKEMYTFQNM